MENLTDAMYMSFSIFIFVIALALSLMLFRTTLDTGRTIIQNADKKVYFEEYDFEKILDNINKNSNNTTISKFGRRYVTSDSIIPVLYRYSKENLMIKIYEKQGNNLKLYHMFNTTLEQQLMNILDKLQKDSNGKYISDDYKNLSTYEKDYLLKYFNEGDKNPNPNNLNYDVQPTYMFRVPWRDRAEDIKKRVEYFVNGISGYINGIKVDYSKNNLKELSKNNALFEEIVIEYYADGEYTIDSDYIGNEVITNTEISDTMKTKKVIEIIYIKQ